ncbi:T9SS type A sorting domain-containing protein [Hymenobacter tibetensis]|uniref:T9SS type A sorting domain-containing protein n=2 Tax=Hymenobacter tibetensis TaxID=497967 RepID=A0ABY4D3T6_9BACT|nr:T9SS type A sorting domain-containing protein [Hymenobacter tibetensis]
MNSGTAAWGNIIPPAAGNTTNLDSYSARYRGSINIAQAGTYTFYLSSDDASYLWIDGAAVPAVPTLGTALINNGGTHGAQERTSATINLSAGLHNILLFYGEQFGENTFTFSYAGTTATGVTIAKQIVPNTILCAGLSNIPPVATTVTNSPAMANTNGPTTINSLAGTDQDGTVTGYVITTLPTPAQGVLSLNNVAVTAGQVITAAQAAQLQFDPAGTFNGPTASFTFQAVDNTGQYSNDAVAYNIPVFSATNIAGTVFEDVNYGGGSGRTLAASSGVGRTGATVELYNASGALVATTTTTAGGAYSFTGVGTGTYSVRVVNSTVTSSRTGYVAGLIPVQTFVNGDVNRVGGEAPEKQDAAANTGSQTLAQLTSGTLTAQSIASVTVGATPAPVSNVNFGFNFDVVTNTNNTGQGSLRQFITNSNALGDEASLTQSGSNAAGTLAAGKETSIFMIPSGNSVAGLRAGLVSGLTNGVAIISPTAVLPTITGANTTIDGTTQTFNVGNTNSVTLGAGGTVGTAATALSQVGGPEVQIVGARATYNGLNTTATNTTFRGLSIYGFTDNINTDINAANVLVEQNVIGASATSFTDPGATARTIGEGINLTSSDNGIIRNNLVGFNGGMGIWVLGNGNNGANNNLISNNEIRGNAREATAAPERLVYDGVELQGASTGNTVSGNLITESVGHGIDSFANTIGGNTVSGNTISNNGQGVVNNTGEEGSGIRVFSTTNPTNITGNVLTGNNGSGVFVVNGGNQVTISQNSIFSNTRLGIDLLSNAEGVNGNTNPNTWNGLTGASSNVTINDNGDGDGGGNGLLNFPVITSATIQGTNLVVQGFARPGAVIEFFNPGTTADGSGFGEGQTYLGTFTEGSTADTNAGTGTYGTANINGLNQGTDNTNRFTFTIPLTGSFAGLTSGSFLTSTATIGNSTSEFSGNAPVNTPPVPRDVTNVAVANNSGPLVLNPNLTATANGLANGVANTIASYTVTALPTSGTLAYNGVTLTSANIATTVISDKNLLTYQPAAGFSGSVSFTYTATDANGIVSTTHLNEAGTTTTAGPATYTIPVNAASDVTTTLAGPTILNAGLPSGTFTATFTNNGPNAASNVTQQVTLPAGATNIIVPAGATTSTAGGLTTINFGTVTTLASGVTNTFNYSFTAPTTSGSISQNSNVGTGSSQGANTAADVAILNGTVNPVADVATTIVGSAASVPNGQPASFTVTFTNNGPSSASGVTGSVQLPVGLTGVVVTGAAGTYNSTTGVVTYSLGTVANGGTTNSVISFTMPANGAVTAISTINTTTNEAGQTANDVASATISGTPTFDVTTLITGPATTVAGTMTTYSVLTINNGPSTATNIGQTVQLPANLTNVFVSNGGTYNVMTGVVTFPTLGAIASGVKVNNTVSFVAPAFVAPATTFPISATVSGDTNTANNTAFLNGNATLTNVEVTPASTINANIYTTITTPSAEALPGAPVTFTVVAGNKGQSTATNVVERIALPAGLTGVTISGNGATNANYDPSTGLVTLPTINSLVSGSANTYTITVSAPTSGMIAAVASISAATNDVMVADNVATTDVTVNAVSDVATTISGPAKVNAGQSVTYNVTTTNNGLVPAANVVQTVNIPAGLTSVILSGNGTYNPNTGIVTFPAIASQVSGNTVQNTITYNAPAVNSLMVIASVTSASPDNVKTNNTASVTTTTDAIADATVVISGPTTIVQGNQIDYLVVTTNNGPSTAANVATRVQLPSGLTGVVLSQGGAYNSTTGVVTFSTLATQRSGQEGTITNVIRFIAPAGVSQINATASVSTTTEEASYGNNTSSIVTTEVAPTTAQTNLSNTISSTPSDLTAGQPVTLSVTTTNGGTNAATGVVQRVALEVGLTITSISNNGTYDPATGIVTFPAIALPSGTAVTNTIVLAAPGTTPLQVRALVTGEQSDPVSTNNSAFLSLDVTPRADVLTTVSGPTSVVAGDAVTYSVVTLNNGPSLAASVVQTVTIPTGLTGVVVSNGGTYNQMTGVVTFSTITTQGIGASGQVMNTISFTAPSSAYTVVGSVSTTTTEPAGAGTNNSSTVMVGPANLAPVANSVVNALQTPEGNTAGPLSLSPLQGTDANGNNTIASYRITSIPPTTQGVLSLNGTAVVVGQPIDAADAGNLKFDPAAGFIGNAFFGYNAVDNAGAVSAAPALYTIPVGQDINSVYTLTTPKGEANPYVNGDIIANVFDVNSGAYNNATPQAVTDNGVRTASLTTGTLPAGTTLDPATGIITVTNRALLVAGSYPVTITTVDANGGTNPNSFVIVIGTRPLPVELKTFTVRAEKVDALLDWTTASEKNSDRFEIERSLNSTTFEKIGTVRAQGTTQNTTTYAFTDAGIGAKTQGIVYYRLRQVDTDGTVSYSPVRTVRFEAQAAVTAKLSVFPNPATASDRVVTLDLSTLPKGTYQASLLDATGRLLGTYSVEGGVNKVVDVQTLPTGTYIVVVRGNGLNLSQRLIKE